MTRDSSWEFKLGCMKIGENGESYDLLTDLSALNADLSFRQLLKKFTNS